MYLCKNKKGKFVVLEYPSHENGKSTIDNGANILKELDHPNIIKLLKHLDEVEIIEEDKDPVIISHVNVFRYCSTWNIFDYLIKFGRLTGRETWFYFKQLISGLKYLHSQGVFHRNIKPENLLLDEKINLKISDFSFATKEAEDRETVGSNGYMPPEKIMKPVDLSSNAKQDIFSAGVILFVMLNKSFPFSSALPDDKHYWLILERDENFFAQHSKSNPNVEFEDQNLRNLIFDLLCADPTSWLSLEQIIDHPWM